MPVAHSLMDSQLQRKPKSPRDKRRVGLEPRRKDKGKNYKLTDLARHMAQQTFCFLMLMGMSVNDPGFWTAYSAFSAVSLKPPQDLTTRREQARQLVRLKTDFFYIMEALRLLLEEE